MSKKSSKSVWGSTPAGAIYGEGLAPGTKEFFEKVRNKRSAYEMPWLFELIPFSSFRDKRLLETGCGAGFDAYEFLKRGAVYIGVDIAFENVVRTQKHLGFYGFYTEIFGADAENLPFKAEKFDIIYSNGVLHHTPDIDQAFREAYRVLKKGGEFWVIVYHRNSIFYFLTLWLFDHVSKLGFLKHDFRHRLSMIEYTTSTELPLVNVYTGAELKKLLKSVGFAVESLWVRKLLKEDLPAIPLIEKFWRFIPQPWLDFIGKAFGWYVIAKVIKV